MRAAERLPGSDPADRDLAAGDEILQVMYWMRGEGLADRVGAAELAPWVGLAPGEVARVLERLAARGWVERANGAPAAADAARYTLTPRGVKEGGRRFADEFSELTRAGHGECSDPDCDCRESGPEACTHHQQHTHP